MATSYTSAAHGELVPTPADATLDEGRPQQSGAEEHDQGAANVAAEEQVGAHLWGEGVEIPSPIYESS